MQDKIFERVNRTEKGIEEILKRFDLFAEDKIKMMLHTAIDKYFGFEKNDAVKLVCILESAQLDDLEEKLEEIIKRLERIETKKIPSKKNEKEK